MRDGKITTAEMEAMRDFENALTLD
jgi:hypothetical protein